MIANLHPRDLTYGMLTASADEAARELDAPEPDRDDRRDVQRVRKDGAVKSKPKSPEVYVQRSRFGKRGPAVMASAFATGAPGQETGTHDEAEPAGAHLKVKLGDLVSLEQFKQGRTK